MSESTLLKLYPEQKSIGLSTDALAAEFLDESLAPSASSAPLIYANLLTSLDGRIALADQSARSGMTTPSSIRSDLDWNLFCHLQAHADVLVTHSGYLRSLESEELGNILNLTSDHSAIKSFRDRMGLSSAPRVVILSSSLDFNFSLLTKAEGKVTLLATLQAPQERIETLKAEGFDVVLTDDQQSVSAEAAVAYLHSISARNAYLQTGPAMLHNMLASNLLQRLYLTQDLSFVGGELFKTICEGTSLSPAANMQLRAMYLATHAERQAIKSKSHKQQLYMAFSSQQDDD